MTPEQKKELDKLSSDFKKLKKEKKSRGVVIHTNPLIEYFKRETKGHTEFRMVVYEDGSGYVHVLGRDSETFNFNSL